MSATRIWHVVIGPDPPGRLDKALSRDAPEAAVLSRSRLAKLIAAGAVTQNGRIADDPSATVREGNAYDIAVPEAEESPIVAETFPLDIAYEDDDVIVVNKPAGMVVHPAPGARSGTLVNALMAHCGDQLSGVGGERRPGIVHRIDKDTSGLLVAAKNDRAHHGLARQFEQHTVTRRYQAVTHGVPDASNPRLLGLPGVTTEPGGVLRLATQIGRHRTDRQKQAVLPSGGRHAVTRLRVIERFGTPDAAAVVECWLETGRTHQIRVHMAYAGHALIGDPVYGGRRKLSARALPDGAVDAASRFQRQALHAAILGFEHPVTGGEVLLEAPLPADLAELSVILRGG
ncbi:MAG: RluA family pseudouridine synthase [Pseudomonadota bacterium]